MTLTESRKTAIEARQLYEQCAEAKRRGAKTAAIDDVLTLALLIEALAQELGVIHR